MSFEIPDHVRPIREAVRSFIEEKIYPREADFDLRGSDRSVAALRELMAEAKEQGLWALGHPKEIGGQGCLFSTTCT